MVFDEVTDGMQTAVHGTSVVFRGAKVAAYGWFLIAGDVHGVSHQFVNTGVFHCSDGHDRHTQQSLHVVYAYRSAVTLQFIHHIQREDHRPFELH